MGGVGRTRTRTLAGFPCTGQAPLRILRFAAPVAAAAAVLAALGCMSNIDDSYAVLPAIGSELPSFQYTALDHKIVTPESLLGSPTVIALWSTTCTASRMALASIAALDAAYVPRGAHVVIVADDHDSAGVASVLASAGVQMPVALGAGTLRDTFTHGQSLLPWRKTFPLPTFLVLDATGRVVYRQVGIEQDPVNRLGSIRTKLDSLLDGPAPKRTDTSAI